MPEAAGPLALELREFVTVLRRHIGEQEKTNSHLEQITGSHEQRIQDLRLWQAEIDSVVPKKWLDVEEVEQRFEKLEESNQQQTRDINKIGRELRDLLTKIALIWGIVMIVGYCTLPPLVEWALTHFFGK